MATVNRIANFASSSPYFDAEPFRRTFDNCARVVAPEPSTRRSVVCSIEPVTFLTSLCVIEAAVTLTTAVVSSALGSGNSINSASDPTPVYSWGI